MTCFTCTIHGPGYSGANGFGRSYDFGRDISMETHTFAVEREAGEIRWYVDGILYHHATPADVAGHQWVLLRDLDPAGPGKRCGMWVSACGATTTQMRTQVAFGAAAPGRRFPTLPLGSSCAPAEAMALRECTPGVRALSNDGAGARHAAYTSRPSDTVSTGFTSRRSSVPNGSTSYATRSACLPGSRLPFLSS